MSNIELKNAGLKVTLPRVKILSKLENSENHHLSAEDIYKELDLSYIVPELREDLGEIEAAEENRLPNLITIDSINGAFHNHTTLSDGEATLEQMADEAQKLKWKYLTRCFYS